MSIQRQVVEVLLALPAFLQPLNRSFIDAAKRQNQSLLLVGSVEEALEMVEV